MKINQILAFYTLAQYGNVSKAADALHMSQPSVSNTIKELEKEYNVKLFVREKHGVKATKEGIEFARIAKVFLSQTWDTERKFHALSENYMTVKIGTPPQLGNYFFPGFEKKIKSVNSDVRFDRFEYGSIVLRERLRLGDIDAAIFPGEAEDNFRFGHIKVSEYKYQLCLSKHHALANRKTISIHDIAEEPIVMLDETFANNRDTIQLFEENGLRPNIALETNQFSTLRSQIIENKCIGLVYSAYIEAYEGDWVGIPLEEETKPRDIFFYWDKQKKQCFGLSEVVRILSNKDLYQVE